MNWIEIPGRFVLGGSVPRGYCLSPSGTLEAYYVGGSFAGTAFDSLEQAHAWCARRAGQSDVDAFAAALRAVAGA